MTLALGLRRLQHAIGSFVAGIGFVERNARMVAANLDAGAGLHVHPNDVMQRQRLIDGAQLVKAVGANWADLQSEVDLREGADGNGHGKPGLGDQ